MKQFILLILLLMPLSAFSARADLTTEETTALKSGERIKKIVVLKDKAWPQVTMISIIPYTPKQNMEIFSDFESHKKFIPDLKKSKIVKKVSPNETHVSFVMKMPWPLSNSRYTTTNIIENTGDDYKLTWKLVKANQMKDTEGLVLFEAFEGKTLFTYTSHITPNSSLASLFKDRVAIDVEKAVKVIIKHLNRSIK